MIRDEKIHEAAFYKEDNLRRHGYTEIYIDAFTDGFYEGISWADSTPNWHKNDETPEEEGLYLVLRQDIPIILYWNADEQCWDDPEEDDFVCTPKGIVAWMELPQPPKFD